MKYAFINATVLDGSENMQPKPGRAVLVEDGIIKEIYDNPTNLGEIKTVDLENRYLMPGLLISMCICPARVCRAIPRSRMQKRLAF